MSQVAKKRISQIHQLENVVKEDPKEVNGISDLGPMKKRYLQCTIVSNEQRQMNKGPPFN